MKIWMDCVKLLLLLMLLFLQVLVNHWLMIGNSLCTTQRLLGTEKISQETVFGAWQNLSGKGFYTMLNRGKSLRQILAPWLTLNSCRVSNQCIKAVKASSQQLVSIFLLSLKRLECMKLKSYQHLGRLELDHLKPLPPLIPLGTESNWHGVVCPESEVFSFLLGDSAIFCVQYVNIH